MSITSVEALQAELDRLKALQAPRRAKDPRSEHRGSYTQDKSIDQQRADSWAALKQGFDPRYGLGQLAGLAALPMDMTEMVVNPTAPNRFEQVSKGIARGLGQDIKDYEGSASNAELAGSLANPVNFLTVGGAKALARAAKRIAPTALVGGSAAMAGAYSPEVEAVDFLRPLIKGVAHSVERYRPSELDVLRTALQSHLKPKALPSEQASSLLGGVVGLENNADALGYLYRDASGAPSAYATLLDQNPAWLESITRLGAEGRGAGKQVMQDLRARHGMLQGMPTEKSKPFYQKIGATLDPETGYINYSNGGPVQKFAGGGLALLRKALTGQLVRDAGTTSVVKNKGGNWLSGSVEGALSGLKKASAPTAEEAFLLQYAPAGTLEAAQTRHAPLNKWIDKKLTGYVKNQMATPEDPVRALAEQGILHFQPYGVAIDPPSFGTALARETGGFPREGFGKSELSKQWEGLSDRSINNTNTAGGLRDKSGWIAEGQDKMLTENPWLNTVPGDTRVHEPLGPVLSRELGFSHLTDELSNSLNAQSGLPAHLQLKPQDLDKMGMDQAVRHVAKVNDWRAAQKMELDAMRANNAATVLHKEYPENNPKGLRWMELKRQEGLPEGWTTYDDPITGTKLPVTPEGKTITGSEADPRYAALRDALKYEGDTMGHCVGGYCDDVASGRTRIMSLRDAKGEPHVTIEVQPGDLNDSLNQLTAEEYKKVADMFGSDPYDADPAKLGSVLEQVRPGLTPPPNIRQIKGKQNKAPNPEYLPFVQDFVKSGQWSDVEDLQNTGLVKLTPESFKSLGPSGEEAYSILKQRGEFLPETEMKEIYDTLYNTGRLPKTYYDEGFAHGGSVNQNNPLTSTQLEAIIQRLRQEHSHA